MCELASFIITPDDILYRLDTDSHEAIVDKFKLKDDTKNPNFVRVEVTPNDGDIFNHDLKNWTAKLDQDLLPKWFKGIENYETSLKKLLKDVIFKERFIIDKKNVEVVEVVDKNVWIKNSKGIILRGSSSAELWGSSSAVLLDSSSAVLRGSSSAELLDSSSAELRDSSSKIKKMFDNSVCTDHVNGKIIVANPKYNLEVFKQG
jgi:hypothetical protein